RVSLFVTCLVDQLWPSVGVSAVAVLRRAGCDVAFDPRQTCCGQPAFNTGYRHDARRLAQHFIEVFEASAPDAIVCPSGSCTAMVHRFPELFLDDGSWADRARTVAARTHEFASFLVNTLGCADLGATYHGRITWHDSCHGLRELGVHAEPRKLLTAVRGLELVELADASLCCGFGGTFSVKYPEISVAMADAKIAGIREANVRAVVAGDTSCLMHLGGRLARLGAGVETMHLAEVLASREG
ncbi:MAG: (Fe-S)-binding protein, partial [Bacteroidales bacterium]